MVRLLLTVLYFPSGVVDPDDGLDLEYGAHQRLNTADPAAVRQVLERLQRVDDLRVGSDLLEPLEDFFQLPAGAVRPRGHQHLEPLATGEGHGVPGIDLGLGLFAADPGGVERPAQP